MYSQRVARQERKSLTRNRILDAAVVVLGRRSFLDATIDEVAREAGVTRVTVYAHFPDGKAALVEGLVARAYAATDVAYGMLSSADKWTRHLVRQWLERVTDDWRELAPTIRVLTTAGPAAARRRPGRYRSAHEHYVELLAGDPGRWPGTSPAEARQRALMAVLQVESLLTVWLAGEWPLDTEDPVGLLADAVCHLLEPALHD